MSPDISIVIPIYNEESNIDEMFKQVTGVMNSSGHSYELVLVNDGSKDRSAEMLNELYKDNKGIVRVIHFARNFGHQLALSAGLDNALGKAAVVMDADLQDPPEVILSFIKKWEEGYKIVYGVRQERQGETQFKKATAVLFYRLIRWLSKIEIMENVGDFLSAR